MASFPVSNKREAINCFRTSLNAGKHWYLSLLEAMRDYPGHDYLVGGDALDWLRMAGDILENVKDLLSSNKTEKFLRDGKPPVNIDAARARQLIGEVKYCQYLNFLYGVTIETALVETVTAEVIKERHSLGLSRLKDSRSEAIVHVYGFEILALRRLFMQEAGTTAAGGPGFETEFTYWLFKYRLKHHDKEKVASDTKKALDWLKNNPCSFRRLF